MMWFTPPPSDEQNGASIAPTVAIFISLMVSIVLAAGFFAFARTSAIIIAPIVVIIVLALLFALIGQARRQALTEAALSEKRKPFAPGQDMYSLIDRMLVELDEEELAYLRRRLAEMDQAEADDLAQSLGELLDKRAEVRRRR